jgi:hypothetical protein
MTHAEISAALSAEECKRLMETVLIMYDRPFKIEDVQRYHKTVTVTVTLDNNVRRVVTI